MGLVETDFEAESKRVLRRLLGGTIVDRDVHGEQNTRDFDLVVGDIVHHAVEVTSVQLPSARATRTGIEQLRELDLGLTATWFVLVHEEAPIRPIEKNAPRLLNRLHASGMTEFDETKPPADERLADAVRGLASLQLPKGNASTAAPFRLHAGGFGSGVIDPANLTRSVESEAWKDDNRRKLASASGGATRHLFVWLHDSHWYVSSLLRSPNSTPPAPLLPAEVDVIWVAVGEGSVNGLNCSALLRDNGSGFVEINPVSGAELPRRIAPGAAGGPPDDPPDCPSCDGHGTWTVSTVSRLDHSTGRRSSVLAWQAECSQDATHWTMPGRALSARELHKRPHGSAQ